MVSNLHNKVKELKPSEDSKIVISLIKLSHPALTSDSGLIPYSVPPFHSLKSADADASKKSELENRGRANFHLITIARFTTNSSSILSEAYFVQMFDAFKQIITQAHGQPSNSINPYDPLIFSCWW